jgi:vacuolar-type H+-ATPase subunit I/STV1
MASHREKVRQRGQSGREFARHSLSYARTTEPLRGWVNNPYLAPDHGQTAGFEKEKDSHISHLEDVLRDKDQLIRNQLKEINLLKETQKQQVYIEEMKSVIGLRDRELEETRARIEELEATLDKYHRTLPYRLYALLRRVHARNNP